MCPYDTTVQEAAAACGLGNSHHCSGLDDSSCGWKQDGGHHKYRCEDGSLAHDCMRTGWYDCNGERYYLGTDGKMVTGDAVVDGAKWCFDQDGKLIR